MTFSSFESSIYDGRPVRLYEFKRGAKVYTYSSIDRDVIKNGVTFEALDGGVIDSGINQTGEEAPDSLTITIKGDNTVAQMFKGFPPSTSVTVKVYYGHYGDDSSWIIMWSGEVRTVKWPSIAVAEITCNPFTKRMSMSGLRLGWTRNCPYAVYSEICGVDREAFALTVGVSDIGPLSLIAPGLNTQPDGWWQGGMIRFTSENGTIIEYRGVVSHTGDSIEVFGGTAGLEVGSIIKAYPGCRQTVASCKDRFNNLLNYGGVPAMSGKSPFDGNSYY